MEIPVFILILAVVSFDRADGVCFTCYFSTDEDKCGDPYSPPVSESDICDFNQQINADLCKRYSGGYQIRCQTGGISRSCQRTCTTGAATVCFTCPYNTHEDKCTDLYTPPVAARDVCVFNKQINADLCKRYSGGYQIRCQTGGITRSCKRSATSLCANSSPHHVTASLVLTLTIALVTQMVNYN